MNNLETRIREHYTRELHPMVFELLDEWKQLDYDFDSMKALWDYDKVEVLRLRAALKKFINKAYGIVELDAAITDAMEALEKPDG